MKHKCAAYMSTKQNWKSFRIAVLKSNASQNTQLIDGMTEILFNIQKTAQRRKQITSEFKDLRY